MGVTELRADKAEYRKESTDTKIPSLRDQRDKKTQTKKPHSFVFVLFTEKELQSLLVL